MERNTVIALAVRTLVHSNDLTTEPPLRLDGRVSFTGLAGTLGLRFCH